MVFVILGVVGIGLGANIWKRSLPVGAVRTGGNHVLPSSEILRLAAIPKEGKLFDVDIASVRRRLRQNPFIRAASVNREGPEGISISVDERMPIAALLADQLLYIDQEGYVLPSVRSDRVFDLPVLSGAVPAAECVPGRRLTGETVVRALNLLVTARHISDDLYRRISEVHIRPDGEILLHTAESGVPVLVGSGDVGVKLLKFDKFWREFVNRRGPQELHYVDLRFEDQVVARWRSAGERP